MADGSIVMVGCTPDCGVVVYGPAGWDDTTCEKPAGWGSEEQKLPAVTFAGMPYRARSFCRAGIEATAVKAARSGQVVSARGSSWWRRRHHDAPVFSAVRTTHARGAG
jgi:hypothetical protein